MKAILIRAAAATAVLLFAIGAGGQDFKLTPAKEIASNPQRFWARGVVFRDTLLSTPGHAKTKIADRAAFPFQTRILGECHADEVIAPTIRDLQTGREYIFTATVYSESRGFWIRKRTLYRYLITGVAAPAENVEHLVRQIENALESQAERDAYAKRLEVLRSLIHRIQEALTAIAASEQIERAAFFDPDSEHFEKLIQSARRAVSDLEVETNIPGREHLAQTLVALVALEENRLKPLSKAQPREPGPAYEMEEDSVPVSEPAIAAAAPVPAAAAVAQEEAVKPAVESLAGQPVLRRRGRAKEMQSSEPAPVPSLRVSIPLAAPATEPAAGNADPESIIDASADMPSADTAPPDADEDRRPERAEAAPEAATGVEGTP